LAGSGGVLPGAWRALAGAPGILAGALLVCVLAGVIIGRADGGEARAQKITSSALTLWAAPGWEQAKVPRQLASVLTEPVAAAPAKTNGFGLTTGRVADAATVERLLGTPRSRPIGTRLGRLEAWRFSGLRPRPNLIAKSYLVPTTGGPVLVVCSAPRQDASDRLSECEGIASTIALRGERPVALSTMNARQERLGLVMSSLRHHRLAARRRLARAQLSWVQASAAREAERSYLRAARGLERSSLPGIAPPDEVVRSLRAAADAYGRLARAAARGDSARYRAATGAVIESEAAVRRLTVRSMAG
jgi:hypothetical protein